MTRTSRRLGFAAVVLAAAASQAAAQALPAASTEEILAGARSCAAATAPTGVDAKKLEADGWSKASVSVEGKASATPMVFYGKGTLVAMFDPAGPRPLCLVSGRISSAADFSKLQSAFATAYGAPVKDDGKGAQIFIAPDHRLLELASTGTSDRPSVRVLVGPVIQETK